MLPATGPSPTPECWNIVQGICDIVADGVSAATVAYSWSTDPLGSLFQVLQDGASSLGSDVFPGMLALTSPDLSAQWWLASYAVSFGAAVLVMAVLILWQIARAARARDTAVAGSEVFETLFVYTPIFFVSAMFGPVAGLLVNEVVNAMAAGLAQWATGDSFATFSSALTARVDEVDPALLTGGVVMGVILMLGYNLVLAMLLLVLLVQMVSLYLLGVIVPLGMVMMLNPSKRSLGSRLAWAWLTILLMRPLVIGLLGVVFQFIAATTGENLGLLNSADQIDVGTGFTVLIESVVIIVMMGAVSLSPLFLMRFAPVLGAGAGSAPQSASAAPIGAASLHAISQARSEMASRSRSSSSHGGGGGSPQQSGSAPAGPAGNAGRRGGGGGSTPQGSTTPTGVAQGSAPKAAETASRAAAGQQGAAPAAAKTAATAGAGSAATAGTAGVAAAAVIGKEAAKAAARHGRDQVRQASDTDAAVIGEEAPS